MASLMLLLFGLAIIALGVWVMKRAFTVRKRANLVEETPTEDVGSVSMGQSEIKGTAKPVDEGTIEAPMSDDECLVGLWEVRELQSTDDGESWNLQGNGVDYVPFAVDDGTGRALVRPSEDPIFELDEGDEEPITVRRGDSPPPGVEEFLERDGWRGHDLEEEVWQLGGWKDTDGYSDGDRIYSQNLLQAGDDAYVFGVAQPRDDVRSADNPANVVFEKVPEEDADLEEMFMISDLPESELTERTGRALKWYAFGIFMSMFGFVLVLVGLGVIG